MNMILASFIGCFLAGITAVLILIIFLIFDEWYKRWANRLSMEDTRNTERDLIGVEK